MTDTYYIQNKGYCGNCIKWWRIDGHGYTDDLREAWEVDKEKAISICQSRPKEDIPWPVLVAKRAVRFHVTKSLEQALSEVSLTDRISNEISNTTH